MTRARRLIARRFLASFEDKRWQYDRAAIQATKLIKEVLLNSPASIHLVSARCKKQTSLSLKLFEKEYGQPSRQLTDLIAARVVTYHRDDVPLVVNALTNAFQISWRKSINKYEELDAIEFGYTSTHLIVRTKGSWSTSPEYSALKDKWFEIQVRSILEHAWAEIEHEVVYKSGIVYPDYVKRRFARVAGAIEILEAEFLSLRNEQDTLVEGYKRLYTSKKDLSAKLDSARLVAFLECERPDSAGWRSAARSGKPFAPHSDNLCTKALEKVGIRTGRELLIALTSKQFMKAEKKFSEENRISEPPSHLTTARLIVCLRNTQIFNDYFPELQNDPAFSKLLKS
jgi:ppGpp synthetase/RelA/SpoT-type nucleotidyltranferase